MTKTAVVLFSLGGPDSEEAIRPYLKNFFMDKNIIRAPWPVRMVVSSLIAGKRSKKEAGTSYGLLGGKSPLLENTQAQATAIESALKKAAPDRDWKTFTVMRYWHPRAADVAAQVRGWSPDRIMLVPLYPQYSTTTTRSSLRDWDKSCRKTGLNLPTTVLCCYPFEAGFIDSSARLVRAAYQQALEKAAGKLPRVLFSAHGLPEKVIADGDPYQWQCEESARRIAAATGIENLDWQICYQSRVGPLKWIGPSTEEALEKAAEDQVPVIVYPHAFVSEHVETLVEIEMEYRHFAQERGVPGFTRVPTVSVAEEFINGLARQVIDKSQMTGIVSHEGRRICPSGFRRCCQA
jgi:protoporphyrin/coproporphyrin ferrochelatase